MKSLVIVFAIVAVVIAVIWYQMRSAMTAPFVSTKPSLGTPTTADPPLMTTIANEIKMGTTIATTAAGAASALGIGGGAAAATAEASATAAATGLSTAPVVASAPTSVSGAIGIGAAGTIALVALPIGLFLIASYFGRPCPQPPEVIAALQRAYDRCGPRDTGSYGLGVASEISYKNNRVVPLPYTLWVGQGGLTKSDTEFQAYIKQFTPETQAYIRAQRCWVLSPDAQFIAANFVQDC